MLMTTYSWYLRCSTIIIVIVIIAFSPSNGVDYGAQLEKRSDHFFPIGC